MGILQINTLSNQNDIMWKIQILLGVRLQRGGGAAQQDLQGGQVQHCHVGLCQAWLLALLSHLVLRVVGTMGREVWGEEFDLPPLDLVDETEVDKVETEAIREIEQGTC